MKVLLAIVFLAMVCTALAIVCEKDFCSRVRCANASKEECQAKNQLLKEHGSLCGCCNVCVTKLNKGDTCLATLIKGEPVKAACDNGLVCDKDKHVCVEENQ